MLDVHRKLLYEIIASMIVVIFSVLAYLYVSKHMMYSQTEREEEAHLKRLFGDAWREAKDL